MCIIAVILVIWFIHKLSKKLYMMKAERIYRYLKEKATEKN